jgi:Ca2+-binding EF-hand superfamily protein
LSGSYSPGAPPPQQLYSTTALHASAATTAAFQKPSAPGTIEDDPPALIGQPLVVSTSTPSRPATNWQQQKKISLNTIERDPLPGTNTSEMSMRQQRQQKQNNFGGPAKADLRQLAQTYRLSDEVLKSYQEAFRIFDRNNDGCITREELGTVMKSLGHQPSDNELQDMVNEVDVDGSGTIEFDEFVQMMAKRIEQRPDDGEDLKEAFEVFDRNKDGYITAEELRQVMRSLGENLTDQELNEMMKAADANGDGIINFNEFQEIWTDARQLVMK